MKRYIVLLALIVFPAIASAQPFLVCDKPTDPVGFYTVSGLPAGIVADHILPDTTYGFKLDLASLPVGSYTVTAKACVESWGCSDSSLPFSFSRPTLTSTPKLLKLTP
jgi:hypothetical protein